MKNNHISQISQFLRTRARQQASWNGKHTTVIEPHYPVLQGQTGLTLKIDPRPKWVSSAGALGSRVDKQQTQSSRAGCRPVNKQLAND
jgi:hypothetical protein